MDMLLVCIVIFLFIVNFLFTRQYYPNKDVLKFQSLESNLQILAIGSGPGRFDINFSDIPHAKNLCVWPQDFRYDYRMIKHYRHHFCKEAVIVHAISPLSFTENIYSKDALIDRNYVRVLPPDSIDLSTQNYFLEKYIPAFKHPKELIKYILGIERKFTAEGDKKVLADNFIKGWLSTNPHLKDFKDPSQDESMKYAFEKNKYWLTKMIDFCDKENLHYVPLIVPMGTHLKSYFSKEFLDVFLYKNIYESGIKKNDIIDCLSYRELEDDELYYNGLFLNDVGSNIMTNIILKSLKEASIV